jgi:glutamine amidotransferase
MCRWFAYISEGEDCLLEDVLITPSHSLVKQVNEHYLPEDHFGQPPLKGATDDEPSEKAFDNWLNIDGFGMVWYTPTYSAFKSLHLKHELDIPDLDIPKPDLHPAQYRTIQPPINDTNFRSLCANSSSKVVLAHIRATSGSGVVPINNHPFIFGIHSLMHNGLISSFEGIVKREIIKLISNKAYDYIHGTTDSEHFAALFMTYLCPIEQTPLPFMPNPDFTPEAKAEIPTAWEENHSADEMKEALLKTIKAIIKIQKEALGEKALSNFFNIAVTDGKDLVACRFRNHKTLEPTSLYYSTTAGTTLDSRYRGGEWDGRRRRRLELGNENPEKHAKHVIIASEPSTREENEWAKVMKNKMLLAKAGGNKVEVVDMNVDDELNAPNLTRY